MLKLVFCIQVIVREGICYFTSNPTGNVYLCFKEPTEYKFTFSYMTFFGSIVLCLKSPVFESNFMYVCNSCISRCMCRYT